MNILLFVVIFVLILGVFCYIYFPTKYSKTIFLVLSLILLNSLVSFRATSVGIDTQRYSRLFYELEGVSILKIFSYRLEPGYGMIAWIFSNTVKNFNVFLIVLSSVAHYILYRTIRTESKNYFISVLCYIFLGFFTFSFSGIRQWVAMIICLSSFKFLYERKLIKFLISIAIAASFHFSAIILVPVYFISQIKLKRINMTRLVIIWIFLMLSTPLILEIIIKIYYRNYPDVMSNMLENYVKFNGISKLAIFIILTSITGIYLESKYVTNSKDKFKLKYLVNISILSGMIQSLSMFSYLFTRLNMYLLIFNLLFLPLLFCSNSNNITNVGNQKFVMFNTNRVRIVLLSLIIVLLLLLFIFSYKNSQAGINPYKLFWNI